MTWAIMLLQAILTFDPYSVKSIEYRPQDAKTLEDGRVAYHQVMLTFERMVILKPGESVGDKVDGQAPRVHPETAAGIFSYKPKDCKPLHDIRQHYVCVDHNWGKQPPTIFWTPIKKQADPMPERREPLV